MAKKSLRNMFVTMVLGLIGTLSVPAIGRSVDDYIHGGAGKYIQGRIQEASVEVEEGLRKYPNDSKLKALAGQLKAMQDQKKQDQNQSGSQGDQDPNKKDDSKDKKNPGDSQNSDQKKDQDQKDKDKDKEKADQQKAEEEKKKQEEQAKAGKEDPNKKNKGDSTGQAAAPVKPGEMSKEEAERLLNSYQNDEKKEHEQMQRRQQGSVNVEKDW